MLGTSTTPYDLQFRFLGVPVRIHPIFWLVTAGMGWRENNLPVVLLWVAWSLCRSWSTSMDTR